MKIQYSLIRFLDFMCINSTWINLSKKVNTQVQLSTMIKIKNRTTIWYSNSTSGTICKANKNINLKAYLYSYVPMFMPALFTIAKTQKQSNCPLMDEWIWSCGGCVCVYMCVCVYICVCVCICIYIYRERDIHTRNIIQP